ncbi:hypothetical protein PI125_g4359 [Phytophthora idaei]|nr:hypothetical protein PI125_g4359 [Phytophthora idaei]
MAQPTSLTAVASKSPSTKRGHRKNPAWDEVIVSDGNVSCKKCEHIIHQLGEPHVSSFAITCRVSAQDQGRNVVFSGCSDRCKPYCFQEAVCAVILLYGNGLL